MATKKHPFAKQTIIFQRKIVNEDLVANPSDENEQARKPAPHCVG